MWVVVEQDEMLYYYTGKWIGVRYHFSRNKRVSDLRRKMFQKTLIIYKERSPCRFSQRKRIYKKGTNRR